MRYWIVAALFLAAMPAAAQEKEKELPLSAITPIMVIDLARFNSELQAVLKIAEAAVARAQYWEAACRSTPECGGK